MLNTPSNKNQNLFARKSFSLLSYNKLQSILRAINHDNTRVYNNHDRFIYSCLHLEGDDI